MSQNSFQPPSPSLSPMSQLKQYQQQLSHAHEIIDQLELQLASKENKSINSNQAPKKQVIFTDSKPPKGPVPSLKFHQKNIKSLKLDDDFDNIQIKQFITPRESKRISFNRQNEQPIQQQLQLIKERHENLMQTNKEEVIQRQTKINEIKDAIGNIQAQIQFQVQQQSGLLQEKEQVQKTISSLSNQIKVANDELSSVKDAGQILESTLSQISIKENESNNQESYWVDNDKENSNFQEVFHKEKSQTLKRKRRDSSNKKKKNNNKKLVEQMNELKNEINEIYKLKEQYEEYYGNRIVNLEKEIDHYRNASSVSMNHNNNSQVFDQLNANLTPNKNNVQIFSGEEPIVKLHIAERCRTTGSMDEFRMKTESQDFRMKTESQDFRIKTESAQMEKAISIQSFKASRIMDIKEQRKDKNRSCDACNIF